MRLAFLIPTDTKFDFMRYRKMAGRSSIVLAILSAVFFVVLGLNYGIDFRGGILMEIRTQGPADIGELRGRLSNLGLGEVQLQAFGNETDVLIRIESQPGGVNAFNRHVKAFAAGLIAATPAADHRPRRRRPHLERCGSK